MITSDKNPKIQQIRALVQQTKERKKSGLFVAEGVRLLEEAVQANWKCELVLYSETLSKRGKEVLKAFQARQTPVEEIPPQLMSKLADTETPQGILAVLHQMALPVPQPLTFALICDSIQDPGNLGTILRTAAAANVQCVFIAPGSTDPFASKVVRAGMGAHFTLPIIRTDWENIQKHCKAGNSPLTIYMASANAQQTCWQVDLTAPTAILVGNEAAGPGSQAQQLADLSLSIPMPGKSESLNAAIAAGILLFETVRQRSI